MISKLLATISWSAPKIIEIPEGFESFGGKMVFVKYEKPIEDYDVKALVYTDSTVATSYRVLYNFEAENRTRKQALLRSMLPATWFRPHWKRCIL